MGLLVERRADGGVADDHIHALEHLGHVGDVVLQVAGERLQVRALVGVLAVVLGGEVGGALAGLDVEFGEVVEERDQVADVRTLERVEEEVVLVGLQFRVERVEELGVRRLHRAEAQKFLLDGAEPREVLADEVHRAGGDVLRERLRQRGEHDVMLVQRAFLERLQFDGQRADHLTDDLGQFAPVDARELAVAGPGGFLVDLGGERAHLPLEVDLDLGTVLRHDARAK